MYFLQIDVNPTRPLYQYSLDRKNKVHTYTCEQNAQILLRLERERQRRNSGKQLVNIVYLFFLICFSTEYSVN